MPGAPQDRSRVESWSSRILYYIWPLINLSRATFSQGRALWGKAELMHLGAEPHGEKWGMRKERPNVIGVEPHGGKAVPSRNGGVNCTWGGKGTEPYEALSKRRIRYIFNMVDSRQNLE